MRNLIQRKRNDDKDLHILWPLHQHEGDVTCRV
jgi:hypothetical protein